jgi:hypothetical protein
MPHLSKTIEGSGYHPEGDSLGFHFEDLSVLMEPRRLTIIGAETEAQAQRVMDWIREKDGIA